MKELNYSLSVILMIPYMVVIAKMLLHFISYIAFNISYSVRNKRLKALDATFGLKESDRKIQKDKILRTNEIFYNFNDWFNEHLRYADFKWWCGYCSISCIIAFISLVLLINVKSDFKKEKALLESDFKVIRQYNDFEKLPMWEYDKVGVIKRAVECNEKYFTTKNDEIKCKFFFIKPENLENLTPINVNKMLEAAGISKEAEKVINDKYTTSVF